MKRVVIESPLSASTREEIEKNKEYAKRAMRDSLSRGEAPYASHLLFDQPGILDDHKPEERELGMQAGFAWGAAADLIAVYTDRGISNGMRRGVERAIAAGQRVEYRSIFHFQNNEFHFHSKKCYSVGPSDVEVLVCQFGQIEIKQQQITYTGQIEMKQQRITYTAEPDNCCEIYEFIGPQPPCPQCNDYGEYEGEYGPKGCLPCSSRLIPIRINTISGRTEFVDWGDTIIRENDKFRIERGIGNKDI